MLVVLTIVLLLVIVVNIRVYNGVLTPLTLFVGLWVTVLWVNRLPILDLYEPRVESYLLLVGAVFAYSMGFLASGLFARGSRLRSSTLLLGIFRSTWFKAFHWLALIALFLSVGFFARRMVGFMETGSTSAELRNSFYTDKIAFGGGVQGLRFELVWNWIVYPATYILFLTSICLCLYENKKANGLRLVFSFAIVILLDFVAMARSNSLVCSSICVFVILFGGGLHDRNRLRINFGRNSVFVGALLCILAAGVTYASVMSFMRTKKKGAQLIVTLGYYLSAGVTAFDCRDEVLVKDGFLYSIGGICDLTHLSIRGVLGVKSFKWIRAMNLQPTIMIGPAVEHNALYTWCLPFYHDFGPVGVVVCPALFGLLTGFAFNRFRQSRDVGWFALFLICFAFSCVSVLEWRLEWSQWTALLIAILILTIPRRLESSVPHLRRIAKPADNLMGHHDAIPGPRRRASLLRGTRSE